MSWRGAKIKWRVIMQAKLKILEGDYSYKIGSVAFSKKMYDKPYAVNLTKFEKIQAGKGFETEFRSVKKNGYFGHYFDATLSVDAEDFDLIEFGIFSKENSFFQDYKSLFFQGNLIKVTLDDICIIRTNKDHAKKIVEKFLNRDE